MNENELELSWEEWKTLGRLLYRVRNKRSNDIKMLKYKYLKRPHWKKLRVIDKARSYLDDLVFLEFPEKSHDEKCQVIYCGGEFKQ